MYLPVVMIDEVFTVDLVILSLHGHSISGLRPLLRLVMLFITIFGRKEGCEIKYSPYTALPVNNTFLCDIYEIYMHYIFY